MQKLDRLDELEPYVKSTAAKLSKVKEVIDSGDKTGAGPISWADLIYLAGRETTLAGWKKIKVT
jgi:hypothetical protein